MNQETYYGTIIHWFSDIHRGSIMPDKLNQRIFADGFSLAANYLNPRTGDRVRFSIDRTQARPSAQNVELAGQNYQADAKATITLVEWDFMQNGGFGTEADNPGQPIFILGQFLADQSRVPEVGDRFEGKLFKHKTGQWMMSEVTLLQAARPENPFQTATSEESSAAERQSARAPAAQRTAELPGERTAAPRNTDGHGRRAAEPEAEPDFVESIYKLYKAPEPQTLVTIPPNQVLSGTITSWDDAKGYGFIRFGNQAQNLFFHISAFHYATSRPKVGQCVSFYCKRPVRGEKQRAAKVVLCGDETSLFDDFPSDYNRACLTSANMPKFLTNSLIGIAFIALVASYSKIAALAYLVLSAASYLMYKFDKQIAQTPRKKKADEYQDRIPEKNLHIVDLLGGWPGALISRALYNHKTSKVSFVRIFRLTVAINIAITYALLIHYADNPILSMLRN